MTHIGVLLIGGLHAACTSGGPAPALPAQPDPACLVSASAPRPSTSIATDQSANPVTAPVPQTAADHLVFRQLYETLVSIDCGGTVRPLLAESWAPSEQGTVWQFRLRAGVRFSDGSAVTPSDIAQSWSAQTENRLGLLDVASISERELRVTLRAAVSAERFADPALAIARRTGAPWRLGTGPYRVESTVEGRQLRLVSVASDSMIPPAVEFRNVPGGDARRALDRGIDALITADPAVLAYARALRDYVIAPLSWNRTYVVNTRTTRNDTLPLDAMVALRGTVRAETRAAVPPFWWQRDECRTTTAAVRAGQRNRNIVYPIADPIARDIAERLVALAWPVTRAPAWLRELLGDYTSGSPVATGVDQRMLLETLRTGRALAVVTALPRNASPACLSVLDDLPLLLGGWAVTPLLDARDHLVHRGLGRVTIDGDGVIRFAPKR